jgi:hypothetical protein
VHTRVHGVKWLISHRFLKIETKSKIDVRDQEPEDLAALTVETAAMAGMSLAGTKWVTRRRGG